MTDKQIIDGVDVSGCNFTLERDGKIKCECCHATGFGVICDCESWKTCDYKNYKRKEQECEELKEKYKWYDHYKEQALYNKNLCNEKSEQLDQLKAENYKLKKTLKAIKKDIYNIGKLVPIFECETIAKDLQQILEKVEGVEND